MGGIKMAKASKKDLQKMYLANNILENIFHYGDGIENITKDDFDHFEKPHEKKVIDRIFKKDGTLCPEKTLTEIYGLFDCGTHGRVVMGCDILISNCCDPELDHLDFKPEIKQALEAFEKGKEASDVSE